MESILRRIFDWVFVGTDTESPAEDEMPSATAEVDPLTGDRDGLGHHAAPEDPGGE